MKSSCKADVTPVAIQNTTAFCHAYSLALSPCLPCNIAFVSLFSIFPYTFIPERLLTSELSPMLDTTAKKRIMASEQRRLWRLLLKVTDCYLRSEDRRNNRHWSEWRLFSSLRSSDFLVRRTVIVTVTGPTWNVNVIGNAFASFR